MKVSSVSFIIPTYNNASIIETVVNESYAVGTQIANDFEIIVCNDASRDDTSKILHTLQIKISQLRVLTHHVNEGYGKTIKELYYAAKSDWLFSIPGDGQIDAKEVLKLLPFAKDTDMVIGWRVSRNDPKGRIFQSSVYNILLRVLFSINIHDVNSVRLMKTSIFKKISLTSISAFVDAELLIQTLRNGFVVKEVHIKHRRDQSKGSGGHVSTIFATIVEMIRFSFAPLSGAKLRVKGKL